MIPNRKEYMINYYKKNKEKHNKNCKKYRETHKEEIAQLKKEQSLKNKEHIKEHHIQYYHQHKKHHQKIRKQYYENNKDVWIKANEKRKQQPDFKKKNKVWQRRYKKKNEVKLNQYSRKYRLKFPEKTKARHYANKHNQRGNRCLICGLTEHLEFHHTDYEARMGFTACVEHHQEQEDLFKQLGNLIVFLFISIFIVIL